VAIARQISGKLGMGVDIRTAEELFRGTDPSGADSAHRRRHRCDCLSFLPLIDYLHVGCKK